MKAFCFETAITGEGEKNCGAECLESAASVSYLLVSIAFFLTPALSKKRPPGFATLPRSEECASPDGRHI
jgi:hypothetical protein